MYENSGAKIKGVAATLCAITVILGVIIAIMLMVLLGGAGIFLGIVVLGVFSLMAWVSNLLLAGFGELVENSAIIAGTAPKPEIQAAKQEEKAEEAPAPKKVYPPDQCPQCGAPKKKGISFCPKCGCDFLE